MRIRRFAASLACTALWCFPALAQVPGGAEDTAAPNIAFYREHPPSYTPGEPIDVTITVMGQGAERIRALGLEERLPEEWTLISVQEYSGDPPQVLPIPGARPPFQFAWITPPALPCVFSYTVQVPEDAWGNQQLYGFLEYRIDLGAEQTPPTVTEIAGPEPQPPTLTLLGDNPVELRQNTPFEEPGYTALDHDKQDISSFVTVSGSVDPASPGTYTLEYRVSSSDTGLSATAARTVNVVTAPASQPASSPLSPRGTQAPYGVSASIPAAEVTGVPQPQAAAGTDPGSPSSESPALDLPDLSAYRPVPHEVAEEGESGSEGQVENLDAEEPEAGAPPTPAAPAISTGEDRESMASPPRRTKAGETVRKHLDTETALTRARRKTYWLWAGGILLVGAGVLCAAFVWRLTNTPSKKGKSHRENRG